MSKPRVTGLMVIKNEENWVWYSIMSVLDYLDELVICDTGSTDKTVKIVQSIVNPKIKFFQKPATDAKGIAAYRQLLLAQITSDWVITIDGDEVWLDSDIRALLASITMNTQTYDFYISPYYVCLGDVYHYQEELAGNYKIHHYSGHITFRAFNKKSIPGIHYVFNPPEEGLADISDCLIQDRQPFTGSYLAARYLHMTHLDRSAGNLHTSKKKYELGIRFPKNFVYPKVFFLPHPPDVPSAWSHRSPTYYVISLFLTPLRYIHRRIRI